MIGVVLGAACTLLKEPFAVRYGATEVNNYTRACHVLKQTKGLRAAPRKDKQANEWADSPGNNITPTTVRKYKSTHPFSTVSYFSTADELKAGLGFFRGFRKGPPWLCNQCLPRGTG